MSGELQAALNYATSSGWPVFPGLNKKPHPELGKLRTARAAYLATTDPEQIRAWWARWPDAQVGISCGAAGLIVIDVDGPLGAIAFAALGLPFDDEVTTGRDGEAAGITTTTLPQAAPSGP